MSKHLVILIFLSVKLFGQDSASVESCEKYRMGYHIEKINNRRTIVYEMGGKTISSKEFVERLNSFPESAAEYSKIKKSKTVIIASIAAFPLLIVGGIYARQRKVSSFAVMGGGLVTGSLLQGTMSKSLIHWQTSLAIYNRKVCENQ